ncbi:MAG: TspO/MBR family protein [Hoeflea sp.]|uniref:TspO/MBR family protein n=1 Tax=Hoeflea sp. TaxID=1940281 RepID=UPI002730D088|nr:TspO/MBR family protein [Hoeflea sp.]MDP2120370.1 TspO/MBR family protein [Hoeflea sp.]MDP3526917.1 TspO/MBR family protein [Hoeflea sp.]
MTKTYAVTLIVFVVLTVAGGSLIGVFSMPGPWYQELAKPWFNPPNWIFGPVWTVLYILIGIAGARVWIRDRSGPLPKVWFAQIALNFLWPLVFFTAQRPDLALVVLAGMLVSILAFIALAWRRDRPSALMFLPYALWVSFAGLLNAALWWLNRF